MATHLASALVDGFEMILILIVLAFIIFAILPVMFAMNMERFAAEEELDAPSVTPAPFDIYGMFFG